MHQVRSIGRDLPELDGILQTAEAKAAIKDDLDVRRQLVFAPPLVEVSGRGDYVRLLAHEQDRFAWTDARLIRARRRPEGSQVRCTGEPASVFEPEWSQVNRVGPEVG